jgi:hypothetical protein
LYDMGKKLADDFAKACDAAGVGQLLRFPK